MGMRIIKFWGRKALEHFPPRFVCFVQTLRSPGLAKKGRDCFIHPSAQILGRRHVALGSNTVISQDCWLNVNDRTAERVAICIGNHCFIGRRNFFSSGAAIRLGDFVLTANDCHFLGSSHVIDDPLIPLLNSGTDSTDTITVGVNTFVGAGARIIGNVSVGHGCVIGAGSTVTRDIPPFSLAHGQPARVSKRYSFAKKAWIPAHSFDAADESSLLSEDVYLRHLKAAPRVRMPYVAAGTDMGSL